MKRLRVFPGIIFVLLGMNVLIVAYTVYAANSDGGAAIEPDYYQKALAFDELQARQRENDALGWAYRVSIDQDDAHGPATLRLELRDAAAEPVTRATVRAVAFPSFRATERKRLLCAESQPGVYSAPIAIDRPGQWRVELTIESRGRTILHTADIIPAALP